MAKRLNQNIINLNKHLQSLNASVGTLHGVVQRSIQGGGSGLKSGFSAGGVALGGLLPKAMMGAAIGGLAGGAIATVVTGLASRIADGVFKSDEYQAKALAFNREISDLTTTFEKSNTWGAWMPMQVKLASMQYGLETELNTNIEYLAMKTAATGQNTAGLMGVLRQGQIMGGMNNYQLQSLAATIEDSSNTYGVSIDTLVGAVGRIASDLRLGALGITEKMTGTIAQLTAKFGPGSDGIFGPFIQKLLDPAMFQTSLLTGTLQDIEDFLAGGGDGDDQLLKIASKIANSFDAWQSQGAGLPVQLRLQAAERFTGGVGMMSKAIIDLKARGQLDKIRDPMATLSNQLDKMLGPIDLIAQKLFPIVLSALQTIAGWVEKIYGFLKATWDSTKDMFNKEFWIVKGLLFILNAKVDSDTKAKQEEVQALYKKGAEDKMEANRKGLESNSAQSTNRYLMLSSESMKNTLNSIIFQGNLQRKLVELTEAQLKVLDDILKRTGKDPMPAYGGSIIK